MPPPSERCRRTGPKPDPHPHRVVIDSHPFLTSPRRAAGALVVALAFAASFSPVAGSAADVFVERTREAGIDFRLRTGAEKGLKHLVESMIGGCGWFDYDGDGLLDLYLVQGHDDSAKSFARGQVGNRLFRNLGNGKFVDVTAKAGVGDRRYGSGVAAGDFDNDGDTDLYVTNCGPNVLYENQGDGTFRDASATSGTAGNLWSASACFLDVDGDGLLDLYVANYLFYDPSVHKACTGNKANLPAYCHPNKFDGAPDALYLNRGGGKFEDITKLARVGVRGRILSKGLGVLPTDFNEDGRIDVFVANDSVPNFLWRNLGRRRFEDAALEAGVALDARARAEACMGIDGGDVDGDGRIDYVVTNFSEETDTLYLNEGDGFFDDGTPRSGLSEPTFIPLGFGVKLFDYDLDGDLDLYVARGHILDNVEKLHPGTRMRYRQPDQLFTNDGRGKFSDVSATSGSWFQRRTVGRGAAFADYDNDGDTDIFVVNNDSPSVLLENRSAPKSRWIGFEFVGGGPSNRDAYGARIDVKISTRRSPIPLELRTAASYLAVNDHRRVIGLGATGEFEWLRVRWPDGMREEFRGLPLGRYHRLERGSGSALGR